eukprot:6674290-Prymnesium_polylepis.1
MALIKTQSNAPKTQVVYVEADAAVWNEKIRELYDALPNSVKSKCVYDKVIGHSFLSRYDTLGDDKFWLEEVHTCVGLLRTRTVRTTKLCRDGCGAVLISVVFRAQQAPRVVVPIAPPTAQAIDDTTKFLVTRNTVPSENNDARCALECTSATCPYSWSCSLDGTCTPGPSITRRLEQLQGVGVLSHDLAGLPPVGTQRVLVSDEVVERILREAQAGDPHLGRRRLASTGADALWNAQ